MNFSNAIRFLRLSMVHVSYTRCAEYCTQHITVRVYTLVLPSYIPNVTLMLIFFLSYFFPSLIVSVHCARFLSFFQLNFFFKEIKYFFKYFLLVVCFLFSFQNIHSFKKRKKKIISFLSALVTSEMQRFGLFVRLLK